MFLIDYPFFFLPFSMIWLMLFIYSICCLYTWVWDVESSPLHADVLLLIGYDGFGHTWASWVEKRELPSGKKKNLVRRDAFSGYGGCRPKFARMAISLFCSVIDVQGLSGGHAEWPSIFCSMSNVWWVSGRNGRMTIFSCIYLLDAESVFFIVFVVLLGRYLCCIVMFMFIYYLLTYLVSLNLQKR